MKTIFLTLILLLLLASASFAAEVKEADLAGSWYPASGQELRNMLDGYIDKANPEPFNGDVLAAIVPHAGYQFSAPVAAYVFKLLKDKPIKTVVIVGFSHRRSFDGISVYDRGSFRTPLGDIAIDEEFARSLIASNSRIKFSPELFREENSVEMQVPFIQISFKDAKIVPVAFGTQDYNDAQILADSLAALIKDRRDVLILASTDMSHYHTYEDAVNIDKFTINIVSKFDAKELYQNGQLGVCELCGLMPVTSVLLAAKNMGYDKIKVLKYANSGDTFGDKTKVVGYMGAIVYKNGNEKFMLNTDQRKRLLQIARESITNYVRDGTRKGFTENDPVLTANMGAFVTLHEAGELRGCIGNMIGEGPLYQTVANMAIEAATGDPRFSKLSPSELDKIDIEISVLSPLKRVDSYKDVNIPGDGVLIRKGFSSGVYLPQVATETGWSKEEFLTSLCAHKAGLSPDAWKDQAAEIYTFRAEVFGEKGEGK